MDEINVKHLEFLQAVIARLAGNGFLLKGWALTVAGAFFGFGAKEVSWPLAALGLLPVGAFWGLDGYFLLRERQFRKLYDAVCRNDPKVPGFSMDYRLVSGAPPRDEAAVTRSWRRVDWRTYVSIVRSITLAGFYGPLVVVGVTLTALTAVH